MADSYKNEDALVRDYSRLSQEGKEKVWKYMKNLIRLQKAEREIANKLYELKGSPETEDSERTTGEVFCDFCGKPQHELRHIIAGPDVYICDECVKICEEVLEEVEAEDAEENNPDSIQNES